MNEESVFQAQRPLLFLIAYRMLGNAMDWESQGESIVLDQLRVAHNSTKIW
jgi:hypothetical protein